MKHTWLFCALCAWLLCITELRYAWVVWLVSIPFLYRRQAHACIISFCLLGMLMWRMQPQERAMPKEEETLTITDQRSSYAIASWEKGKLVLYGAEAYGVDDTLHASLNCQALSANRNFHLFDWQAYMEKRGITAACTLQRTTLIKEGNTLRSWVYSRIQAQEENIRLWLSQSLLHKREDDSHHALLFSSGMHISLLLHGIFTLLTLWMAPRRANGICLALCACFLYLDGFRDSLLRICLFRLVAWCFPKSDPRDRLGIAVLLLLFCRPFLANELVFVLPFLFQLIHCFQYQRIQRRMLSFLVLVPLQFYYFHTVDVVEILLFPLYRLLLAGNFVLAISFILFPWHVWYGIAQGLLALVSWLGNDSLCVYYQPSCLFVFIWIVIVLGYVGGGKRRYLCYLCIMALWSQLAPYVRPYAQVMMLDVGQGDCFLIRLPFHQGNILIDAAGSDTRELADDIILPVLQAQGITTLDLVIITHEDLDHCGSLSRIQEMIPVKQVIDQKQTEPISFGNFTFHFLLSERMFDDPNENSILTYIDLFGTSFLFMGDAGKTAEQTLMLAYPNLHADVLKIGHHGSNSATSLPFLQQLHPTLALISCGAHNRYGHPHEEPLKALAQMEVPWLDTPHYGAVSIKISNIFCIYETASHEFGIIKTR